MQVRQNGDFLTVILALGEEVLTSLTTCLEERGIRAGIISGIGAVMESELGYFDVVSKGYIRRLVGGSAEIVTFNGNISTVEGGKIFIHSHIVLGLPDFSLVGGHFFRGTISVTGEFFIRPLPEEIHRTVDPASTLKLIQL